MPDAQLHYLLVRLADAIRDLPPSELHGQIVDRFFDVVHHLEATSQIDGGGWSLASRRG